MKKDSFATIELTCVMLPDDPDETDIERTENTRAMWRTAKRIAERFGTRVNFSEHQDFKEACLFGDAYVYPALGVLEEILDAFDKSDVEYDNIDLPAGTPKTLTLRLKKRYVRGSGVRVND